MAERFIKRSTLQGIADAIRSKKGTAELIPVSSFAEEILGITAATKGIKYVLADDNAHAICYGIGTATEADIILAEKHEGRTVSEIREKAFYENTAIQSIDTSFVSLIGSYAFGYCTALRSATLLSVEYVYSNAFRGCTALASVMFGGNLREIGDGAFRMCESLTKIKLPKSLTYIRLNAFYGTNVSEIIFAGTVAEWNNVQLDNRWLGTGSLAAPATVVQCSDGGTTITRFGEFKIKTSESSSIGYLFVLGMTWREWVLSENNNRYSLASYNGKTIIFEMQQSMSNQYAAGYAVTYNGTRISPDDLIVDGRDYEREYLTYVEAT